MATKTELEQKIAALTTRNAELEAQNSDLMSELESCEKNSRAIGEAFEVYMGADNSDAKLLEKHLDMARQMLYSMNEALKPFALIQQRYEVGKDRRFIRGMSMDIIAFMILEDGWNEQFPGRSNTAYFMALDDAFKNASTMTAFYTRKIEQFTALKLAQEATEAGFVDAVRNGGI